MTRFVPYSRVTTACCVATLIFTIGIGNQSYATSPVFSLASDDIAANSSIGVQFTAKGFGCTGQNISPELHWSGAPAGTRSFALTVYDPDAPTGSGFYHWTLYNIPTTVTSLARGSGNSPAGLPKSAYGGQNDYQDTGVTSANGNYGGPCPPTGDAPHHYIFTLYALSVPNLAMAAGIPKTGTSALYGFALHHGLGAKVLGTATFTATYGR